MHFLEKGKERSVVDPTCIDLVSSEKSVTSRNSDLHVVANTITGSPPPPIRSRRWGPRHGDDAKPPAKAKVEGIDILASPVLENTVTFDDLMSVADLPKRLAMFDALLEQQKLNILRNDTMQELPPKSACPPSWAEKVAKAANTVIATRKGDTTSADQFMTHLLRGLPMFTYGFHGL